MHFELNTENQFYMDGLNFEDASFSLYITFVTNRISPCPNFSSFDFLLLETLFSVRLLSAA